MGMKLDLHIHTSYGSSCAYMDPGQLVERARHIGLDGVCITDHDQIWQDEVIERLREKHDYLIIPGVEVSTDCGDILVFGLHESVLNVVRAAELRELVDEAGGVMIMAHPFRGDPNLVSSYVHGGSNGLSKEVEEACERPEMKLVDALEVYNGMSGMGEVDFTTAVAKRLNLRGTGGSDAHATLGVGACYTVFEDDIRDEGDFIRQIKEGRFYGVDDRWGKS